MHSLYVLEGVLADELRPLAGTSVGKLESLSDSQHSRVTVKLQQQKRMWQQLR